jgi:hypothetical protein
MQRLARFTDVTLSDPGTFGGGFATGHVRYRVATVAYGYLAVVEEYENLDHATTWCLLTVSLPGLAPYLVVDHRSAFGRAGVPAEPIERRTGDGAFDDVYAVGADDAAVVAGILGPDVRRLLVEHPVQRLLISGGVLVLRTFDGADASDAVVNDLTDVVAGVLSSTPSFVTPRSGRDVGVRGKPLAPGLHGSDDAADADRRPDRPRRGLLAGRTRHVSS